MALIKRRFSSEKLLNCESYSNSCNDVSRRISFEVRGDKIVITQVMYLES